MKLDQKALEAAEIAYDTGYCQKSQRLPNAISAYLSALPMPEPVAYQAAFCLGENVFTTEKVAVEASPTNEARPIYPASAITKLQARVAELEEQLKTSDAQTSKIEALLDPHIEWKDQ